MTIFFEVIFAVTYYTSIEDDVFRETYVNTHWVSTVFLFAGLSVYFAERYKLAFLQLQSIVFCLVCLPIGLGTSYADVCNIRVLVGDDLDTGIG